MPRYRIDCQTSGGVAGLAVFLAGHTSSEEAMRIVTSIACCILFVLATKTAAGQARQYIWSDIDCRQSRIAAWPGLKCRATNVVTSEGNIGVFRQWAAFGTSRDGYYAHVFLWEAQNSFSYLSADETTADFVKGIFEYGKSIAQVSPVARYRDTDCRSRNRVSGKLQAAIAGCTPPSGSLRRF
jgi:hypothetical protein